jgi:hypothetical protein
MDRAELDWRWMRREPVEGVAFLLNDSVRIVSGQHAGGSGAVIAVERLEPEVTYRVELRNGLDIEVAECDLLTRNADDPGVALAELQRWYSSQCDGDWEHQLGIKIETLDNPGWSVVIDVGDTPLQECSFTAVERTEDEREWISCRVENNQFRGAGGPHMLGAIIEEFAQWVRRRKAV